MSSVSVNESLQEWKNRCHDARNGHYKRSEQLYFRSELLGYILIYSTVFVTVFSFFTLEGRTALLFGIHFGVKIQYLVVIIGCFSAVISGIVTQSKYGERAEMHRSSGARYANLSRDIQLLELRLENNLFKDNEFNVALQKIVAEWNGLSEDSLLTPHDPSPSKKWLHVAIIVFFILLFFATVNGIPVQKN